MSKNKKQTKYLVSLTEDQLTLFFELGEALKNGQLTDGRGQELHEAPETEQTLKELFAEFKKCTDENGNLPNKQWFVDIKQFRDSLVGNYANLFVQEYSPSRTSITYQGAISSYRRYTEGDQEYYSLTIGNNHVVDGLTEHQVIQIVNSWRREPYRIFRPREEAVLING